jgi:hypothetical protein
MPQATVVVGPAAMPKKEPMLCSLFTLVQVVARRGVRIATPSNTEMIDFFNLSKSSIIGQGSFVHFHDSVLARQQIRTNLTLHCYAVG